MKHPDSDWFLDFYLKEQREYRSVDPQSRPLTEGIRASSLGSCLKAQHAKRMGIPDLREFDAETLRTFHHGDVIGKEIARMYQRLGLTAYGPDLSGGETRLTDPEYDLSGHVDVILKWPPDSVDEIPAELRQEWSLKWVEHLTTMRAKLVDEVGGRMQAGDLTLVELKTTHSNSLKYLYRDGKPRFANAVQAGAYRYMATKYPEQLPEHTGEVHYRVDYVGKDSFGMLTFDIGPEWADEAERRVAELASFMDRAAAPAEVICSCEGWEVEYCGYGQPTAWDDKSVSFTCCMGTGTYTRKRKATDDLPGTKG